MIRVLLAEDSFVMREGIVRILEQADDIEVAAVFGDADALREAIDADPPDVVVTDIRMPPNHTDEGIRLATELRGTHPEVGVVVLSQHAEPVYALSLFAGTTDRRAYLLKDRVRDPSELQRAVREVAAGGAAVDSRVVDGLLRAREHDADGRLGSLTERERDILRLIAEGRSNQAIGAELGITTRSVEHGINTIFAKLGLQQSDDVNRRVKATLLYLAAPEGDGSR
ncbi:MAG: response regulator transcription factor [Gaiellaceae bacterium]